MFLSDVKQEMLETIVPKGDNESIMVVLGEQRGQVSRAAVQVRCLLPTASKAVVLFVAPGGPYSPEGQEQMQSAGSARPIRGESVHAGL